MKNQFKSKHKSTTLKRYCMDHSGQFAMWFAIAAFPVLVATTYVVDFRGAEKDRANVKSALDVAVLTAVSNDMKTESEKKSLAVEIFETHYHGRAKMNLAVEVSDGRVAMTADGNKEASLARSVGSGGFKVQEKSVAVMNRENTICVLSLADSGKGKLRFLGGTEFNSPTCSVQSNSRDKVGVESASRYVPIAKSFCSAGGASGEFKPAMRGECRVIEDPYADRTAPKAGVCMPQKLFNSAPVVQANSAGALGGFVSNTISTVTLQNGHESGVPITNLPNGQHGHQHCHLDKDHCHHGAHPVLTIHAPTSGRRLENMGISAADADRLASDYGLESVMVTESANYSGSNRVFYPGTYCGGLTVDGRNVTFAPGTYIIKDGPLTFKNGATANAQDVSFVTTGQNAVVTVESGSYVDIKAPKSGNMAGLAFFQDKNAATQQIKFNGTKGNTSSFKKKAVATAEKRVPLAPNNGPTGVNLISSGGELNVIGTMYFPTQALDVLGDSVLGARAPATSFIAHQVTFAGETKAEVAVDYVKGGIPPMLPRSDDGARLVE